MMNNYLMKKGIFVGFLELCFDMIRVEVVEEDDGGVWILDFGVVQIT